MIHVVATDEAGYGPRLGPLVVGLTGWRIANDADLRCGFDRLTRPVLSKGVAIRVDDSKRTHKPGPGLQPLLTINAAAELWRGGRVTSAQQYLRQIAMGIDRDDWNHLADEPIWYGDESGDPDWPDGVGDVANHWRSSAVELVDIRATIIPAQQFNVAVSGPKNKSDLLGETTLRMVAAAVRKVGAGEIRIFCDRLGGRRYYAGLIQHSFPDGRLTIELETPVLSRYRIETTDQQITIDYTVKGDRYPPVAMSSLVAKFVRELLMLRMNQFFVAEQPGLRPTAGYPLDADRFLRDTADLRDRLGIADADLIRIR